MNEESIAVYNLVHSDVFKDFPGAEGHLLARRRRHAVPDRPL
jgi:hypothetical protein